LNRNEIPLSRKISGSTLKKCLPYLGSDRRTKMRVRALFESGGLSRGVARSLTTYAAHAAILTASLLGTVVPGAAADPATAKQARGFIETDLVANKSPLTDGNRISHKPAHVDANLLNPWGLTASPTSPFWV
jgi:hypothetical protein